MSIRRLAGKLAGALATAYSGIGKGGFISTDYAAS
jgi:hypothetical protein